MEPWNAVSRHIVLAGLFCDRADRFGDLPDRRRRLIPSRSNDPSEAGYRYFAESAIPIYYDPNTREGKESLNLSVDAKWLSFRLRPGDDASCLNLYQPQNPRVIGAPASWLKLDAQTDGTIPAAVDANTLTYVLHKKVGDEMTVGNARLKFVRTLSRHRLSERDHPQ